MGVPSTGMRDQARGVVSGTFTGTGNGASILVQGRFNIAIWGTFSATVAVEKSYDAGATWIAVGRDAAGTAATYTAETSVLTEEPENGVLWRLRCSAYTSGTVNWRISH